MLTHSRFNLIIAIHTFMLLTLRIKPPKWCRYVFLAVGWLVPIFGTVMGPVTNKASFSFFGPTSGGFRSSSYVDGEFALSHYLSQPAAGSPLEHPITSSGTSALSSLAARVTEELG